MNPADLAVVLGFFAIMAGIGVYFGRRMSGAADFFRGGGGVPWWLAGVSFYMSTFSALAFVVYSALAYQYGFVAVTVSWVTVPALIIGATLFATRWRRVGQDSPLEYLEQRYGAPVRQTIVWLGLGGRILDDGLKLFAVGTLLSAGMGVPIHLAILGSTIVILIYTVLGGLWASIVADFVQFAIILAAATSLLVLLLIKLPLAEFVAQAPPELFQPLSSKYHFGYVLIFFVLVFFSYTTNWPLIQRYAAVSSDKDARKVGYLVAALSFICPPFFYAPAMMGRVLFPDLPDANGAYAFICRNVLPAGLFGLLLAAMFSGTMSTLAGSFNAGAQVVSRDVYMRLIFRGTPSAARQLLVGRVFTFLLGALVTCIAVYFQSVSGEGTDLFEIMVKIFGFFTPPIALTMLLGLLIPTLSYRGALAGLFSGIAVGLVAFIAGESIPVLRQAEIITIITTSTTLFAMLVGSILAPDSGPTQARLRDFVRSLRTPEPAPADAARPAACPVTVLQPIGAGFLCQGLVVMFAVLVWGGDGNVSTMIVASAFFAIGSLVLLVSNRMPRQ